MRERGPQPLQTVIGLCISLTKKDRGKLTASSSDCGFTSSSALDVKDVDGPTSRILGKQLEGGLSSLHFR